MPHTREQFIDSIRACAKELGRTPTFKAFLGHGGFRPAQVYRHFSGWTEALRDAGFAVAGRGRKLSDEEIFSDWARVAVQFGKIPTQAAYKAHGARTPDTLVRRCGFWRDVPAVFRRFAGEDRKWRDVLALLPARGTVMAAGRMSERVVHARLGDRQTYGGPLNLPMLRHEPTDETGVVLLFGILCAEMGYVIDAVQSQFPDCAAERRISGERWERVRIEFEFESRNFEAHGHPKDGCDVIVCWRHNWKECPKNIEVVELAEVVKRMAKIES